MKREPDDPEIDRVEDDFVRVAKAYGEKKGISYQAWREMGVLPRVLRNAGIVRAARSRAP